MREFFNQVPCNFTFNMEAKVNQLINKEEMSIKIIHAGSQDYSAINI